MSVEIAAETPAIADGQAGVRQGARARTSRPGPLVNLVGKTSLLSAAALIQRARLLVGVDTGLSHMGIAFERPTVLLFGSTCPYTETGSAVARVLHHPRHCSPCRRRPTCAGAFTCMREIEVDEVMATLVELLDQAERTSRPDQPDRTDPAEPAEPAEPVEPVDPRVDRA